MQQAILRLAVLIAIAIATPFNNAHGQLKLESIYPQTLDLHYGVQFLDNGFGVVASTRWNSFLERFGMVAITNDYGQNWEIQSHPDRDYYGVELLSKDNFIVMGSTRQDTALVAHTLDGGVTWTDNVIDPQSEGFPKTDIYTVKYLNESEILAAGNDGRIYKSNDGGATWQLRFQDQNFKVRAMEVLGSEILAIGVFDNSTPFELRLYGSGDSGNTWKLLEYETPDGLILFALSRSRNGDLYGFGSLWNRDAIARSTDNGKNWSVEYSDGRLGHLSGGTVTSQGDVFGIGRDGKIYYRLQGGVWNETFTPTPNLDLYDVHSFGNYVYFSGRARVYRFDRLTTSIRETLIDSGIKTQRRGNNLAFEGLQASTSYLLQIISMDGRSREFNISAQSATVNIETLARGVYVYRLIDNSTIILQGSLLR